jgi:hypothetical protein
MDKKLVTKILSSNQISLEDLNTFVSEYTHEKLDKNITSQELSGIIQMIQMGMFDLRYAALEAAKMLGLHVLTIADKNGVLLKTHIYESN